MAKKTATNKAPSATAIKPATKKTSETSPAKNTKKAAVPKPPLTQEAIGIAAGEVWARLAEKPATVAELKKATDCSDELTLIAIGWLAREGKLQFESTARSVTLSLI